MMCNYQRIFRLILVVGLTLVPTLARAQNHNGKVHVGDKIVNGSFIKPYKNLWRLTYTKSSGESIDAGTWSDEVERIQLNGRNLLKRTQVAKHRKSGVTMITVNIFDPKTMAPVSRDFQGSRGVVQHIEFDGETVKYRGNSAPGGEIKDGTVLLDVPVFDFYGGLWGLLLATFPLRSGYSATLPSLAENTETLRWARFRVIREEMVDAGPGKQVKAWVVETDDKGPMTFWITRKAPYVIKLVYVNPLGTTETYAMI